jgi:hypothetical protein
MHQTYNATFDFEGWTNFAETGTKLWIERDYNNDGYIQFSSFGSSQSSNIGWAITPEITISEDANAVLSFSSASNFVDNPANKLEVFISTDYDGTTVGIATATWTPLAFTAPTTNDVFVSSGNIDLSSYESDNVRIAFKYTGSKAGVTTTLQLDNVKITKN